MIFAASEFESGRKPVIDFMARFTAARPEDFSGALLDLFRRGRP
jgi:hypothetical protein